MKVVAPFSGCWVHPAWCMPKNTCYFSAKWKRGRPMSGYREEKMTPLLSFPYDTFLMVRCEFIQIVGDDLEAKVLRILEKTVQAERKRLAGDRLNRGGSKVGEDPLDIT